jgi:hypothetical protein
MESQQALRCLADCVGWAVSLKNLFDAERADELKQRVGQLRPDNTALWGKMDVGQAMAHCALALDIASGDLIPKRAGLGIRLLGRLIKPVVFKDDAPIRRNVATNPELVITDQRNLIHECERLRLAIDRFTAIGPNGLKTNSHFIFGPLTSDEWAILMYKHIDHHLRQFGA